MAGYLSRRNLLPAHYRALYLTGSRARGWDNESSDVDVVVVSPEPFAPPAGAAEAVGQGSLRISHAKVSVEGRAHDIEYWTVDQVRELLRKASWQVYEPGQGQERQFMLYEINFLDRLGHALALDGGPTVREWQETVRSSAFRAMRAAFWLHDARNYHADSEGQLGSGDVHSAALSARLAVECAVDALLARHGQLSPNGKWRARRFKEASPTALTFDAYWRLQTMQGFDPARPTAWISTALDEVAPVLKEVDAWLSTEHERHHGTGCGADSRAATVSHRERDR
ncbi:nucleotidyltransferase domain-containing protein [Streptomyces sp. NBC_00536]|uniref:nucleotidyltransferase domain-containing protein n=1 Tax=Streptomyces sp. NBC_00536 TaxID=2975769 RepID=UPI002E802478|nr:nucleotidyltransferase domain-containing protein [Streptomyces sp. NBC_00536]WUC83275.1 nucleotidyltransferase domain-containing protein [Streptomyces sp. NBC_00536]